jgi:hypothetical protein
MNHRYDKSCPCDNCLRITFAARFRSPEEYEIMSGNAEERALGNVSTEHQVIGSQGSGPRSSGYN